MVPRHAPLTLNCQADGIPTPTIQWFKDGEPLKIETGSQAHRIVLLSGGLFFLQVFLITFYLMIYIENLF